MVLRAWPLSLATKPCPSMDEGPKIRRLPAGLRGGILDASDLSVRGGKGKMGDVIHVGINQGRSLEAYPSESDTAAHDWPSVLPEHRSPFSNPDSDPPRCTALRFAP